MKTRSEELKELISKSDQYMAGIWNIISWSKSTSTANDFLMKLRQRIMLEIELNSLDN